MGEGESGFLLALRRGIERREKSLKARASLSLEMDEERLRVLLLPLVGRAIAIEFTERRRANIYLRSRRAKNRGKILFRLEDVAILNQPAEIVRIIEATLDDAYPLAHGENNPAVSERLRARWATVALRVFDPDAQEG